MSGDSLVDPDVFVAGAGSNLDGEHPGASFGSSLEQQVQPNDASSAAAAMAFWSQVFLFVMTLGLSASVPVQHLRQRLSNTHAICCGVTLQYTIMPVAGFVTVVLLNHLSDQFTPAMGITLLVLTCSPGGSYSTWWCSQFNADLPLSVSMTTVSSILGVLVLPFHLYVTTTLAYHTSSTSSVLELIDFGTLLQSLAIVITAIVLGLLAGYLWGSATPRFYDRANLLGNVSGIGLVLLGILMTTNTTSLGNDKGDSLIVPESSANQLWQQPWVLYVGVALPFFIGLLVPNFIAQLPCLRLSKPETVAIAIECCYQNKYVFQTTKTANPAFFVCSFLSFLYLLASLFYRLIA